MFPRSCLSCVELERQAVGYCPPGSPHTPFILSRISSAGWRGLVVNFSGNSVPDKDKNRKKTFPGPREDTLNSSKQQKGGSP